MIDYYNCGFDVKLKPLLELYAHDDSYYIEAFLMWQWRYADRSNDWTDCNKPLSFNTNKEYRRKESAGLSFDLERAKKGEACEFLKNGEWLECTLESIWLKYFAVNGNNFGSGGDIKNIPSLLRMKYPQRRQNEK